MIQKGKSRNLFAAGQRWISEMEPDLGLGVVESVDFKRVTISFHDGATRRVYSKETAPLRRIIFKPGDTIRCADGRSCTVKSVESSENVVVYSTDCGLVSETQLSGSNIISAPLDRLLAGHPDSNQDFRLRSDILDLRFSISSSPVRGFAGGRIELVPHQLYIAHEVSSRFIRRVMLADEVGLGKTIEACLILHRLIISGRISQVLIVVPEPMINVWFVELLRKFNLLFSIINPGTEVGEESFSNVSLALTGLNTIIYNQDLLASAVSINWDLLIVDEAHHLVQGTPQFSAIEALSSKSGDVFLLTATPLHFGERNHFERLRLLDKSRYSDFQVFCRETSRHKEAAEITGRILDGKPLGEEEITYLKELLSLPGLSLKDLQSLSSEDRRELVAKIIDRLGIGRVLFRNTRAAIGGFPEREVVITELEADEIVKKNVSETFFEDLLRRGSRKISRNDPRIGYIADLLRTTGEEKILVICRSKHIAAGIQEELLRLIKVNVALFHEGLTLLQRDRNAAWFSEEDGARILICSEIGSEGRNFQFSHHLVLFDLPFSPELVEQRIGRLDRIGQKNKIFIHLPVIKETPDEFLAQWFHRGLGIFMNTVPAAQETFEQYYREISSIINENRFRNFEGMENLIIHTRKTVEEISLRLSEGRDRLLEQHSFRPWEASRLVNAIKSLDKDQNLKSLMKRLFKVRGILVEEFQEDTWRLLSESQLDESFPGLSSARSIVTFNREKALGREDYEFLTIDHPAVTGGIDLLIGSESGNACYAVNKNDPNPGLFLECVFTINCIASQSLFVSRFLPPAVIRVMVDNKYQERTDLLGENWYKSLDDLPSFHLIHKAEIRQTLIPSMLEYSRKLAEEKSKTIIEKALENVKRVLGAEVERLESLRKTNGSVSQDEIEMASEELIRLYEAVSNASVDLDSIRLIWSPGKGR